MRPLLIILCLLAAGCSRIPFIKSGEVSVTGTKDAGTPATLNTLNAGEDIKLKAGSKVIITRYKGVAAKPATADSPAVAAQPEREVTEIIPAGDTQWQRTEARVSADTGTVDTSVRKSQIEAEERRPLLYAAIAAVVAGLGFMYVRFQALAVMCFIGAGAFFCAWKMAEISPWVGGLFLVAAVAGFAFYKRAEWDKNGDGVPDILQGKP